MVEYSKALPTYLPDFYRYLLDYPDGRPANVENSFYWARVKFGLKPTLRVVHVVTMRGNPGYPIAYAIVEKQLYSSHYLENRSGSQLLYTQHHSRSEAVGLLSDYGNGFRADRPDWRERIDCS
jgi:hypothetical protein